MRLQPHIPLQDIVQIERGEGNVVFVTDEHGGKYEFDCKYVRESANHRGRESNSRERERGEGEQQEREREGEQSMLPDAE